MSKTAKEERLFKIVYNSRGWTSPCERVWNPANWEDKNSAYEQRTGFVHEDWLFNPQFLIDGYQYGYIKGFNKLKATVSIVEVAHLFTINTNTKERYYIGKLLNAERLVDGNYPEKVKGALTKYFPEMLRQLKDVGADYQEFKDDPLVFNVRVRKEDIHLFQEYIPIVSSWFNKQYNRTSPNNITPQLKKLLDDVTSSTNFKFEPSTPGGKKLGYTKSTIARKTNVSKVHQEIEEHLYAFLLSIGFRKENIACDTTSFGGKLADVVVQHSKNRYSVYEIKTNLDLRTSLRESIGQLLDYANWERDIVINELISVVPDTQTGQQINEYIARVKKSLNYKLRVLLFDNTNNTFKELK